jgi:hypothetical protein
MAIAAVVLGCEPSDQPVPKQSAPSSEVTAPSSEETAPSSEVTAPSSEVTAPTQDLNAEAGDQSMVHISGAEAAAQQLPAASISLETAGTGMGARKFGSKDQYLMLSGPPGGPLGLVIERVSVPSADEGALAKLAEQRFKDRSFVKGTAGVVELAGDSRQALTCATDTSMAKSHHLLVLIPVPNSKDSLLVDFWRGAGSDMPAPEAMLGEPKYGDLLKSLSVKFE